MKVRAEYAERLGDLEHKIALEVELPSGLSRSLRNDMIKDILAITQYAILVDAERQKVIRGNE